MNSWVKIFCTIVAAFFVSGCFETRPPTSTSHSAPALNYSVTCRKTKVSQFQGTTRGGAYVPIQVTLRVTFYQTGHYRLETWQIRPPTGDVFGEFVEVDINRVPRQMVFGLEKDFYRLRVMRVESNRLETDSLILGSMRPAYPDVLPEDKNY